MNRIVIGLAACLALLPACHHHHDDDEDGGADQGVDAGQFFDLSGDDGATELVSGALVIAPVPLEFHHVPNGTTATLQLGLANMGKKNIVVSSATIMDTVFMFDGGSGSNPGFMFTVDTSSLPLTLTPGMIAQLPVTFAPDMHGDFTGTLTITSDAASTPAAVPLTGSSGYKVVLKWDAPVMTDGGDTVVGYNVYRGPMVGGPYTKINSALVTVTTYTDSTVQDCTIYEYATTSVDGMGNESTYSNQVEVAIPCP
jgi:hypothetical protein